MAEARVQAAEVQPWSGTDVGAAVAAGPERADEPSSGAPVVDLVLAEGVAGGVPRSVL